MGSETGENFCSVSSSESPSLRNISRDLEALKQIKDPSAAARYLVDIAETYFKEDLDSARGMPLHQQVCHRGKNYYIKEYLDCDVDKVLRPNRGQPPAIVDTSRGKYSFASYSESSWTVFLRRGEFINRL